MPYFLLGIQLNLITRYFQTQPRHEPESRPHFSAPLFLVPYTPFVPVTAKLMAIRTRYRISVTGQGREPGKLNGTHPILLDLPDYGYSR